jgi:molecular chaperone GrpE (heat shock protein)
MKTPTLLITTCASVALALCGVSSAIAHEGGAPGHTHGHDAKVTIPDSAEGILQELQQQHEKLTATVTAKNLKEVHDLSENMTALAKALPDKVADDKKQRVQGSVNNLVKLLDNMHHAADGGDHPRTAIEMKKLEGVMKALESQVK